VYIAAAGPAAECTVGEVVGSAPAQLEPSNELIHSDHKYYRTASPLRDADVAVCSDEEVVCEVEVCSEEQPCSEEQLCSEQICSDELCSEQLPIDIAQLNTETAVLPSICDLDLSVLADPELWDHLEQIIDADQLLGQSIVPPAVTLPNPSQLDQEPQKQTEPVKMSSVQSSEVSNMSSPPYDPVDAFSVEPSWFSQSSRTDFETGSGGVGSPFSDDSEDYGFHWEESFMQLFPTLA